jgi:hypothetical protein
MSPWKSYVVLKGDVVLFDLVVVFADQNLAATPGLGTATMMDHHDHHPTVLRALALLSPQRISMTIAYSSKLDP